MEFSKCICLCHCLCLCICLCHCLFFGQIMSPHHSDQISQMSNVSRMALWKSLLFVFVFVIVFVCVFVFVIVFFGQVMSPHHSNQMSRRSQVSRVSRSLKAFSKCICFWKYQGRGMVSSFQGSFTGSCDFYDGCIKRPGEWGEEGGSPNNLGVPGIWLVCWQW